jgi:ADP-ribosylglycohydrolase
MNTQTLSERLLDGIHLPSPTPLSRDELLNKIKGVLFGNALGDALGLRTEFKSFADASKIWDFKPLTLSGWHKGPFPEGDWTDDTDQMLIILKSFTVSNAVLPRHFAVGLKHWIAHGFPELGDTKGLGCGKTVRTVCKAPDFERDPVNAAFQTWLNGGCDLAANGALMRTSVLGVIHFQDIRQVVKQTIDIALVTHADPRCVASCVLSTCAIALILQGNDAVTALDLSLEIASRCIVLYTEELRVLVSEQFSKQFEDKRDMFSAERLSGVVRGGFEALLPLDGKDMGYTYKCLGCATWALGQESWEDAIRQIIEQGGDADTNAAAAGALLAAKTGFESLPQHLVAQLRFKDHLERLYNDLVATLNI